MWTSSALGEKLREGWTGGTVGGLGMSLGSAAWFTAQVQPSVLSDSIKGSAVCVCTMTHAVEEHFPDADKCPAEQSRAVSTAAAPRLCLKPLTKICSKLPPKVGESVLLRCARMGKRGNPSTECQYFHGKVRRMQKDKDNTMYLYIE